MTHVHKNGMFAVSFRPPDMARFSHRSTRLARQRESAVFRGVLMPLSTLVGFIGLLAVALIVFDNLINNRWEAEAFAVAVTAAVLPAVLLLYRWVRGHFNRQLENP